MKIRAGFVSNSSSTSFSIIGVGMDATEFMSKVSTAHPDWHDEEKHPLCDLDFYDYMELIKKHVTVDYYEDGESNYIYVGLDYAGIGDDETGKQFRERAKKSVSELFGKATKVEDINESIYG